MKEDIWKTELQKSSRPVNKTMHFLARPLCYLFIAYGLAIIAFTKSVLHNPAWNRFYSEDSERIVRAEFFARFTSTSIERPLCKLDSVYLHLHLRLIKLRLMKFTLYEYITSHYIIKIYVWQSKFYVELLTTFAHSYLVIIFSLFNH